MCSDDSKRDLIITKIRALDDRIYDVIGSLEMTAYRTKEPVPFAQRTEGEKLNLKIGDSWGELWDCAWFNFKYELPNNSDLKDKVLIINVNGEGTVFDRNGMPYQGLHTAKYTAAESPECSVKDVVYLTPNLVSNDTIDIWCDFGCNDLFGRYSNSAIIEKAYIASVDEKAKSLLYDFVILKDLMECLPKESTRKSEILNTLFNASVILNKFDENELDRAKKALSAPLSRISESGLELTAIGHAHIDLAWLWPIRETRRKAAMTFSTVLRNMKIYDDYRFGASQAQLYDWVKNDYPELFAEIKKRVEEDKWEVQGGMWVEADTNVSGGEALVRQILYGKRFFKEEFNKDMKMLWLPDVFGYSGSLPQILKKSGIEYFMTIKLSWNDTNIFPYHTFKWYGIDNTCILSHMAPEGTYNSKAVPKSIIRAERNFKEKGLSDKALLIYGVGDGGGGPGEANLEALKREKNLQGLAKVKQNFAVNLFDELSKEEDKYPSWRGELYLEKHRGTYTTQARNKLYNRKMELSLRELEFAACLADIYSSYNYPKDEIEKIWKEVLLYQFHDILPGSSIKRVYDESTDRYVVLYAQVDALIKQAYSAASEIIAPKDNDIVYFNSLSWERVRWVNTITGWLRISIPALGYRAVGVGDAAKEKYITEFAQLKAEGKVNDEILGSIENDNLKVVFNLNGNISSIYDKTNDREIVEDGTLANKLIVYNDNGDAWDFPQAYKYDADGEFELAGSKFYVEGPHAVAEMTYVYGNSFLSQHIVLEYGAKRVDFETYVNWQESYKMLRSDFNLNLHSNEIICDIQFGNIKRPTHDNTTWDAAKYEICAHKFVDYSNRDYGVAILNDCKYGYSANDNNISINLLRSSNYPGIDADKGNHVFTYSVYPHKGDFVEGNVYKEAYELNIKPYEVFFSDNDKPSESKLPVSLFELSNNNVIVETVKPSEKGGSVIIRLYEHTGASTKCSLNFNKAVCRAYMTDLLENVICELQTVNNSIELDFTPYEINTIEVVWDNN